MEHKTKTRTVQLTKEQWDKMKAYLDRKRQYHKAIRLHGPESEEAKSLRNKL